MNNILSSVTNITNSNPPSQQSPALAERADIHKSCKSLETLLNVLNDYCEAATAIVTLQKKLAKALRDTSASKVTNETAGNTLNASAQIFEALAEVDAKFVKIADKEYDAISIGVKRWFKKLAKEEKVHDERIAHANAKIKQAGQNFEKKSKKKAADAQDEHSKYIQLISTLGPEVTQEKYNHSLQVTQRHTVTIYSVAACLARIADTEWVRSCESVRRFAPTVGTLGEWRYLCEGGWMKEIPGDLVNLDEKTEDKLPLNTIQERVEPEEEVEDEKGNERLYQRQLQTTHDRQPYDDTPSSEHRPSDGELHMHNNQRQYPHQHLSPPRNEREPTSPTSPSYPSQDRSSTSGNSPTLPRYSLKSVSTVPPPAPSNPASLSPASVSTSTSKQAPISPEPSISASPQGQAQHGHNTPITTNNNNLQPPSPTSHHSQTKSRDPSPTSDREGLFSDPATGSVRSLSAFPIPPTHFPLPPPRMRDSPGHSSYRPSDGVIKESREEQTYIARERLSESPSPLEDPEEHQRENDSMLSSPPQQKPRPQIGGGGGEREHRVERPHSNLDVSRHSSTSASPNPGGIASLTRIDPVHPDALHPESFDRIPRTIIAEREEFQERDFAVLRRENNDGAAGRMRRFTGDVPASSDAPVEFPSASVPSQRREGHVERTDTGTSTNGSIVAAMKGRYSGTGSLSPPPRLGDLPRLHKSVTEMANRYQSPPPQASMPTRAAHVPGGSITEIGELREHHPQMVKQAPSRPLTKSPPPSMGRNISLPSTSEKIVPRKHSVSSSSLTPTTSPRPLPTPSTPILSGTRESLDESEDRLHWRRMEARERELREREQEIMLREKELERDRGRLLVLRDGLASSSPNAHESDHGSQSAGETRDSTASYQTGQLQQRPRERIISFRRLRQDSQPKTPQMRQEPLLLPPQPSSQGNLAPSVSSPNLRERHQSQHSYSSPPSSYLSNSLDPGSSTTSASGPGDSSYLSHSAGSPPSQEKKGGWMRRLSMPVGNALPFSLDSSKRHANNSASSTTSSASATVPSPRAGVRPLGAGIVGGKGVTIDERRYSSNVTPGLGAPDSRDRVRDYEYEEQLHRQEEQDRGRFGGLGLGRKSHDGSRSATNLNLGLGRGK